MPKPIKRQPLWKGPDKDGITQSLLGKFLECRHRFWHRVVLGLKDEEGFSRPLEFGNLWHAAEEARLKATTLESQIWEAEKAMKKYRQKLDKQYPNDNAEVMKWYKVAKTTFPIYLEHWSKHKDETDAKPILEETSFAVPYTLPSGRVVLLRGKWDALRCLRLPKSKRYGIYIKEHKTKGEIDEEGILKTVGWNLQTMMYQIALRECALRECCPNHAPLYYWHAILNYKPAGVLYNVIRRPLADKYAIKQKKGESIDRFYHRMGYDPERGIQKNAKNYFMRWRVEVSDEDIARFKQQTFHPIMEQLLDWWEGFKGDFFHPWNNPYHYQSPWGVYNSLAGGFRGSYFELLTTGREYDVTPIDTLFPELA